MILSKGLRATQVCLQACRSSSLNHFKTQSRILVRLPRGDSQKLCINQFYTSGRLGVRGRVKTEARTASGAPVGAAAIGAGQAAVAGASLVALGGLCYYGMGLASEAGAVDKVAFWPAYVKERVRDTYMYFGGSLFATAGSAYAISQNPTLMRLASSNGIAAMVLTIGAMIGTSILARNIEYKPGTFGAKQLAWLLHTGVVGSVIAPLTVLGGPLLVRAAWYTAGIVGGLSTMAMCAPSDKFLNMGGPLACGLGVVFVSSIGSAFFPPTGTVGMSLYSIAMYGGLVLFGAFLLYDTQKIIKKAETHPAPSPYYQTRPFDPINASMSIYMDTINIFIRIAVMMASNKKK